MRVERLGDGPIIEPATCDSIGLNIQGPSLIAAPPWISEPLGAYYLYFADHKGGHIRLAYADEITGPWQVHRPGALQLATSRFLTDEPRATDQELRSVQQAYIKALGPGFSAEQILVDATAPHIASPDVHVDLEHNEVVMYFHGLEALAKQVTRVAVSSDGIDFEARPDVLGRSYFRVFQYDGWHYALVMPGQILRSRDGRTGFAVGPTLFEPAMRHSAVLVRDETLDVFWTRVGDAPEVILWSRIDLTQDWMQWRDRETVELLRPELPWEGSGKPVIPSQRSAVHGLVNQLRDPAVFVDGDHTYLLYAAAGESCIGLARLHRY